LEKITVWQKGDGASFQQLGKEVWAAVDLIKRNFPTNKITLVGHSRGGLAARAFLQNPAYSGRDSIVGLLTIGTPHQGSPFGRVYSWLRDNPREACTGKPCEDDWKSANLFLSSNLTEHLDIRAPTLFDLTPGSPEILTLATTIGNLPKNIIYGQIISPDLTFGVIRRVFNYLLSPPAVAYILNGHSHDFYAGDVIVPVISQQMHLIEGFPIPKVYELSLHVFGDAEQTFHIFETDAVDEITTMLRKMAESY
jgi:pimeloyl-ACP methyl ester carboxylesterase